MTNPSDVPISVEMVAISTLTRHPRNYKVHPEDQLAHIVKSIEEHGFYRNVVVARDGTILAGHGVVEAATKLGKLAVPVIRLNLDPNEPRALKVLTSDNELGGMAERDDRLLADLLKDIMQGDSLLGTGFDEMALANLIYVTRSLDEIADKNEAAEWVGMPGFDPGTIRLTLTVAFRTPEDRETFVAQSGVGILKKAVSGSTWSSWWPPMDKMDLLSVRFEEEGDQP